MRTFVAFIALCLVSANAYRPMGPNMALNAGSINPQVVGGSNAAGGQVPWQISLVSSGWFGDSHICGGSLIGNRTVVTAAHCCDGSSASSLKVKYDGTDRTNLATTQQVTRVLMHPNWNTNTIDSDYCVLTLANDVVENANVKIIPIAKSSPPTGTQAILSGWGQTWGINIFLPTQLQYVSMSILSSTECNAKWGDVNPVTNTMICAQSKNGDSGGPLTVNKELVGIVSWGANGCPSDTTVRPTVYADPANSAARTWILANTK